MKIYQVKVKKITVEFFIFNELYTFFNILNFYFMTSLMFLGFFNAVVRALLLIALGYLVKNHILTLFSLLTRKPVPEGLIESRQLRDFVSVTKVIGYLIILAGVATFLSFFIMLYRGRAMGSGNLLGMLFG
ncbi:MAG: hypothetical protein MI784_04945 [Cytophagales bacterium]|nr:hypothetical protein [Cytophagales bacterium]